MEQPSAGTAVSLRRRDSLSADCTVSFLHPCTPTSMNAYVLHYIVHATSILKQRKRVSSKSPDNTLLRCWSKLVACTMHVMQHITYLHAW